MGLFSRKNIGRTKWTCKLCSQEFSINDIGAVVREGQAARLDNSNNEGIVANNDEILCKECSQGNLPRNQQIRFAEFAKKIEEDKYEFITLAEVTEFITDLEVFISQLKTYGPYFKFRIEQLRPLMDFILKKSGFPKLTQQIATLINNGQYHEAEALCTQGTHWAGLMEEKGTWEQDLKKIKLAVEVSKSLKEQMVSDNDKYDCMFCKRKIATSEIGTVLGDAESEAMVYTGGILATGVKNSDDVLCKACTPKYLAINEMRAMEEEGRQPTVEKLQYLDRLWNAEGPDDMFEAKKHTGVEHLPSNATRYTWVGFNNDKHLEVKWTCPKCFAKKTLVLATKHEDEGSKVVQLFEAYRSLPAKYPSTCSSCNGKITLFK